MTTFAAPAGAMSGLAAELVNGVLATIRDADSNSTRSLQKALGVSEVGDPCDRKLVYKMFGHPTPGNPTDPWKANVGTAVHEYLRWIYSERQEQLADGRDRYVLEQQVQVATGLRGTCDHYDRKLRTVVDYKSKGDAKQCKKAAVDPDVEHVVQAHCYAQGWINAGEQVDHVALLYLPRNGDLDAVTCWTEPFDPQVVADALARRERLLMLGVGLNVEDSPQNYAAIPTTPSEFRCTYCPWFVRHSTNPAVACPGVSEQPKEEAA